MNGHARLARHARSDITPRSNPLPYQQRGGVSRGAQISNLVLLALLLALALGRLGADLLVVLLEGSEVLAGLGELALLHALADVPVDEGALGVHEVELVVNARVELGDGRRVGHHGDGA